MIIRSQSPVMAGINDDAKVWNKKWKEEVRSRRPLVLWWFHAVDARRLRERRSCPGRRGVSESAVAAMASLRRRDAVDAS